MNQAQGMPDKSPLTLSLSHKKMADQRGSLLRKFRGHFLRGEGTRNETFSKLTIFISAQVRQNRVLVTQ
jgi:hypothetical protein